MKAAGFKAVRMGHLAWDNYEPSEGRFVRVPYNENARWLCKISIKKININS